MSLSDLTSGIGEGISSAIGKIETAANSAFEEISSIFSGDQFVGQITKPNPPPAPIVPLSKTAFELTPFLEKVFVDPYKTFDLATLTKAELSVDSVVDYLEGLLPSDVVSSIKQLKDVGGFLLDKGKSLEGFISDIKDMIPSNFSLPDLLRNVNPLDVFNHFDDLVSAGERLGIDIKSTPQRFLTKALTFMSGMKTSFNVESYASTALGASRKLNNNDYINPIASTSISLAKIDSFASKRISTNSVLRKQGLVNSKSIQLVRSLTSTQAASILAANKLVGTKVATSVSTGIKERNYIGFKSCHDNIISKFKDNSGAIPSQLVAGTKIMEAISPTPTASIKTLIGTNETDVLAVTKLIDLISALSVKELNESINVNTLVTTQGIVDEIQSTILGLDLATVIKTVIDIDSQGLTYWLAHTPSTAGLTALITDITSYGITLIKVIALAIAGIGYDATSAGLTTLNTLTITNNTLLINAAMAYTENTATDTATIIKNLTTDEFTLLTNTFTLYGSSLTYGCILANILLVNLDYNQYFKSLSECDLDILIPQINNFNSLSTDSLNEIINHIADNEPYLALTNNNLISGRFLHFAVRQSCFICAEAGNYTMVVNLLKNYPGTITTNDRKKIIQLILANYQFTEDDIIMGINMASKRLITALEYCYSKWYIINRGTEEVDNLTYFLTASSAALTLLCLHPTTAINAILQRDNNYRIMVSL